ncbi:precorrin-6Y C5,15-methyltransferase [Corynebacterium kutscheri]|uniref:Precorrin-6Y C5,15-methyltransferase n=1 Tax=Corynebacterium kutscheri TaxID=35755 RepID=A0A0F6TCW1_9CORY|nr:bifunctional cobalt-precorrin-7 (C(5))-methyltransferase/cobalt-precorrin-6B (C(15))-methyltransferase [Corynebacterium kutscheri]AKE41204.1 precorrin-6Y C5,15-methyltransferase (decarboxylating) [Corynebacterium kutscheri]VEH08480.1 precorrin-6Y C5,15-methyltransferase [Corynebacterium kutscheri]VEH09526.1 precorrin-6Y C5,15-methyltransferase [Corynebacterium kutscheri]VEH79609.1 precorrin-6Y C5,15-methyltransferase [Corynebacterium kutscheri]
MNNPARTDALHLAQGRDGEHKTQVSVVGIGAGGFAELGRSAQKVLLEAAVIIGSWRQLGLLPDHISGLRHPWPSPMLPSIPEIFANFQGQRIVVLGSGDPMFHGIGTTLRKVLPQLDFNVYPQPSSASLACARLGWALDRTPVESLVTNEVNTLLLRIQEGNRFLVLGRDENSPQQICDFLVTAGQPQAIIEVLNDLGGVDESYTQGTAAQPPSVVSSLNVIAISHLLPPTLSRVPGLNDDLFTNDGQLTKQHIRALTVSALRPKEGETLWDIGGGAGSIAIEFLRATQTSHAVCFEQEPSRQQRILDNALQLGVAHRLAVQASAPDNYTCVPDNPDVIFIGGGLTAPGVFDGAWQRLNDGGRLVANAVTIESEQKLIELRRQLGGSLSRFAMSHERGVGSFSAFQSAFPVTQWSIIKEANS